MPIYFQRSKREARVCVAFFFKIGFCVGENRFSTILKIHEGGKTTFLKRKLSECVRRNENFCDHYEGVFVRFPWHLAVFEKNA